MIIEMKIKKKQRMQDASKIFQAQQVVGSRSPSPVAGHWVSLNTERFLLSSLARREISSQWIIVSSE